VVVVEEPVFLEGSCESFNSKLRDEFLNGEIFYSLKEGCRSWSNA
jgi:hypothetical protein